MARCSLFSGRRNTPVIHSNPLMTILWMCERCNVLATLPYTYGTVRSANTQLTPDDQSMCLIAWYASEIILRARWIKCASCGYSWNRIFQFTFPQISYIERTYHLSPMRKQTEIAPSQRIQNLGVRLCGEDKTTREFGKIRILGTIPRILVRWGKCRRLNKFTKSTQASVYAWLHVSHMNNYFNETINRHGLECSSVIRPSWLNHWKIKVVAVWTDWIFTHHSSDFQLKSRRENNLHYNTHSHVRHTLTSIC